MSEDLNCSHGVSWDDPCRACEEERLAALTDADRAVAVAEAQEQAQETAHDIVVAATGGDAAGVQALSRCFDRQIRTILNKGLLPWTDTS